MHPAWDDMRFRHVCPCNNSEQYAWIRSHSVASLGEMLMILGEEEHTSAEIYSLYRTLRVVVLKRRKDRCSAKGRSSTGSRLSGMAGASVKRELKSFKDLLIEEYSTLMALALPDETAKRFSTKPCNTFI